MHMEKIYLVAGGDSRYVHLAGMLTERGKVYAVGFDNPSDFSERVERLSSLSELKEQPDYLVLPMPVTKNGVTLFTPLCRDNILLSHVLDLCHRAFSALGCQVTVAARSYRDLAWAEAYGAHVIPLSFLERVLPKYRLIINTVPDRLLGEEQLMLLDPDALIIDLASAPGGVDFGAAEELGIRAILALSLPGKTAPVTAASVIAGTLDNIIAERGNEYA